MNKEFNYFNDSGNKIITEQLKIGNNIFSFNEIYIQLKNVEEVRLSPMPKKEYDLWKIICVLLGVSLMYMQQAGIGLILILVGAYLLYSVYKKNKDIGEYLIICLGSGKEYYFPCDDKEFIRRIIDVVINCINGGDAKVVNFNTLSIDKLTLSFDAITDEQWREWKTFLESVIKDVRSTNDARELSKQASVMIDNKQFEELKTLIKNNKNSFINDVFRGVASSGVVSMINSAIERL